MYVKIIYLQYVPESPSHNCEWYIVEDSQQLSRVSAGNTKQLQGEAVIGE